METLKVHIMVTEGWRDGSLDISFAAQTWRYEFKTPESMQKPEVVRCVYNPYVPMLR